MNRTLINDLVNDLNKHKDNVLIVTPLMGARVTFKTARLNHLSEETIMLHKEGDEYVALRVARLARYEMEDGKIYLYFSNDKSKNTQ